MEKHKIPADWIAKYALEPTRDGSISPFYKGCFWGTVLASFFWLVIIQIIAMLIDG